MTPLAKRPRKKRANSELTSVSQLWKDIETNTSPGFYEYLCFYLYKLELTDAFSSFHFVGIVDKNTSMIQYRSHLYLIDNFVLSKDLIYQMVLINFAHFKPIQLNPPNGISIFDLILAGLDSDEIEFNTDEIPDKAQTVQVAKTN